MDSFKALFFSLQKFPSACCWLMLVRMSATLSSYLRIKLTLPCSFYVTFFQFSFLPVSEGHVLELGCSAPHVFILLVSGSSSSVGQKKIVRKMFLCGASCCDECIQM